MENQRKDPSLEHTLNALISAKEAQEIPVSYFVMDSVLIHEWRPAARPTNEDWATFEQVVLL